MKEKINPISKPIGYLDSKNPKCLDSKGQNQSNINSKIHTCIMNNIFELKEFTKKMLDSGKKSFYYNDIFDGYQTCIYNISGMVLHFEFNKISKGKGYSVKSAKIRSERILNDLISISNYIKSSMDDPTFHFAVVESIDNWFDEESLSNKIESIIDFCQKQTEEAILEFENPERVRSFLSEQRTILKNEMIRLRVNEIRKLDKQHERLADSIKFFETVNKHIIPKKGESSPETYHREILNIIGTIYEIVTNKKPCVSTKKEENLDQKEDEFTILYNKLSDLFSENEWLVFPYKTKDRKKTTIFPLKDRKYANDFFNSKYSKVDVNNSFPIILQ